LNLAINRTVAVETPRGWKISKATQSHKVDIVVALGMAALAKISGSGDPPMLRYYQHLAWPEQFPLAKLVALPLEETPEYKAMGRSQSEPCARCGLPLGPSRTPITVDKAVHAGGCPKVEALDSFGNSLRTGVPSVVDAMLATAPRIAKRD
jgi:hypothetical protein